MTLESIRSLILIISWPILVVASIYVIVKGCFFYYDVKESSFGKLVLASFTGWLITMYSLGIVTTSYMLRDVTAVRVVFPIFLAWFATLLIILIVTNRWSKEATTLHAFFTGLEGEVARRTRDLEHAHERELQNQKQIQQLKDEFLFVAAHELRTPVNAIKWELETLLDDTSVTVHLSSNAKEMLKTIHQRNEHLRELISRLLNTARLEQGVLIIRQEQVEPVMIICEVIQEVEHLVHDFGVHVVTDMNNPPSVYADPTLLKEIFINLLTNAIQYNTPSGRVTISEHHTAATATFNVEDTGKGIPKDQLQYIFDKFHHIDKKNHTGKEKSVGLGLYITKELVTRMGGTIYAKSELGKGSVFSFTLPRNG